MRPRKDLAPVDYRACRAVVTLYHRLPGPGFACQRILFEGAFLDISRNRRTAAGGSQQESCFLLVLPSGWQGRPRWREPEEYDRLTPAQRAGCFTLSPGDLVLEGRGPELATPLDWVTLGERPGAGAVKELAVRRWQGTLCHIEAASGQSLGKSGLPHPRKGMMR